jgi:hypothetical protein
MKSLKKVFIGLLIFVVSIIVYKILKERKVKKSIEEKYSNDMIGI